MADEIHLEVDEGIDVSVEALTAAAYAAVSERADSELTIRISRDELLQQLNREHRGNDEPTDVLSFPVADDGFPGGAEAGYLGDVAISVAAARRNAEATGTPLERELRHLVTHGVLHLLGYEHDGVDETARMREREVELLGEWVHAIWDAPPTH